MAYEHKDMSGSMFKNDRKEKDNQPDYKGGCKIDGKLYEVSMWKGTTKDGSKILLNLKFQPPYVKPEASPGVPQQASSFDDGSLPF